MNRSRCWVCGEWTRDDLMESTELEGKGELVCVSCIEQLRERDRNLEAKRSAQQRQRDLSGKPSIGATTQGTNGANTKGQGTEPEPVGSGADQATSDALRKDKCAYAGCEKFAVYTQTIGLSGVTLTVSRRACYEHREFILAGERIVRIDQTG